MSNLTNFVLLIGLASAHLGLSVIPAITEPVKLTQPAEGLSCEGYAEYDYWTDEFEFETDPAILFVTLPVFTSIYSGSVDVHTVNLTCDW